MNEWNAHMNEQSEVHAGAAAARARGLAIYPTHPASGVPVGFLHLMRTMPVLHDATIFLTMRKVSSTTC